MDLIEIYLNKDLLVTAEVNTFFNQEVNLAKAMAESLVALYEDGDEIYVRLSEKGGNSYYGGEFRAVYKNYYKLLWDDETQEIE